MGKRKAALTFTEPSNHGDEDLKYTRRSRRIGNTTQETEPNRMDDAESDDDFVTLPSTSAAPAAAAAPPGTGQSTHRGQRIQQRIQFKDQQKRQAVQKNEEELRQQEEEDILRAIELSKLEMEAEQQFSESQEEWRDMLPLDPQQPSRDDQSLQPGSRSFASRGEAVDASSQDEFSENQAVESLSSSVVSIYFEDGTTPEKMAQAGADHCTEWQDMIESADWEDPSLSMGVANCERGTPPVDRSFKKGSLKDIRRDETSQSQRALHAIPLSQPSEDYRRGRLRRRKRHMEEENDAVLPEQPAKVRKVPTPPDQDETEEEPEEEEDDDIDVVGEAVSDQEDQEEHQQLCPMEPLADVYQLVDTRKPHFRKQPFFAPHNVSKHSYTRVIYQLIQAYCSRFRRAQGKVLTRIGWGKPVVTGNCYSDTLVHRKRGSRACAFYALSDSDEEVTASPTGKEVERIPKGRLQRRKKKLAVDTEEDADSDFEDFLPAGHTKTSAQRRPRLAGQDVVEMLKQDGRCYLEERPDETLSQTLVQDQTDTQDFATLHGEGCLNSDIESDLSQPLVRETPSKQGNHHPDVGKTSPEIFPESQSSLTDIFGPVSSNETDSGTNAVTSRSHHRKSKSPVMSLHVNSSHGVEEKNENSCEEDSFKEEILSLSTSKLNSRTESVKACLQEDKSQTRCVDSTKDSQSNNTAANRQNEEGPLEPFHQREKDEVNRLRDSSLPNVDPLDPSQDHSLPRQSASTQSPSFEELRYQFYLSHPEVLRLKENGARTEEGELAVDLEEEHSQKSTEHPGAERLQEQSQQPKDSFLNKRQGLDKQPRIANGLLHKKTSPPVNKQSSLVTSRNSFQDEEDTTDYQSLIDRDLQHNSCWDPRESDPGEDSGDNPEGDDDMDNEEDFENQEEADQKQDKAEKNFLSEDDADATIRGDWKEEQDETPAVQLREAVGTSNDEVSIPEDGHADGDDALEEEEEEATGNEDGEDDAIAEIHQPQMIGVECPLCSVTFHIDQIEAHASGCNGPTSPQQDERVDLARPPRVPAGGIKPGMVPGQRNVTNDRTPTVSNNNESLAGSSTAGTQNHRDQTSDDKLNSQPLRGVAAKIIRKDAPKHTSNPIQDSVLRKRSNPDYGLDEDSSESFSESTDQLDASLLQLVEDNKIQLRERKRARVQDQPAKRQKLSHAVKRSEASRDTETTELCFLCRQQIPKSVYAEHVQEELDRVEAESRQEDTSDLPRRGLRSRATDPKATGGRPGREAEYSTDQSGTTSGMSHTADDSSSWDGAPDGDSDSDDDGPQAVQGDALFNPRVSESPIRAFRPISKLPMNLIDFKNQFNSTSNSAQTSRTSRSTSGSRGRRRQGRGRRGGKWKQRKKGGSYFGK